MSSGNTLRKLPFELRTKMFGHLVGSDGFKWQGKMPSIIKGLRPDKELYYEALHLFLRGNHTYNLSDRNDWGFRDMGKHLITTIGRVSIEVGPGLYPYEDLPWNVDLLLRQRVSTKSWILCQIGKKPLHLANRLKLRKSAIQLQNVREVTLFCSADSCPLSWMINLAQDRYDLYKVFIGFSKLTSATISCASLDDWRSLFYHQRRLKEIGSNNFGARACYGSYRLGNWEVSDQAYTWVVEEGEYLNEVLDDPHPLGLWKSLLDFLHRDVRIW